MALRTNPLVGTVLNDTYRLERLIAKGGMGAVFEAGHLRLSRRFAVKVLTASLASHPELVDRFRREAEIIAAIGHPHIVEAIDFNHTASGEPYIVMELLEGETLAARLDRNGPFSLVGAARIFMQAASALEAAHLKGVIHRDLKPQNIFLCRRGRRDDFVKIFDFGISKVLSALTQLTRANVVLGTAVYMAPEQVRGEPDLDRRADVYSMGCILHEMLSGRTVFEGQTPLDIFEKVAHIAPPRLRTLRPGIPEPVEDVVTRSLAKSRHERFASMLKFWNELARAYRAAGLQVPETAEERQALWPEDTDETADDPGDPTAVRRFGGNIRPSTGPPAPAMAGGPHIEKLSGEFASLQTAAITPSMLGLPALEGPIEALPTRPSGEELIEPATTAPQTGPPLAQIPTLVGEAPPFDEPAPAEQPKTPLRHVSSEMPEPAAARQQRGGWTRARALALVAVLLLSGSAVLLWLALRPVTPALSTTSRKRDAHSRASQQPSRDLSPAADAAPELKQR